MIFEFMYYVDVTIGLSSFLIHRSYGVRMPNDPKKFYSHNKFYKKDFYEVKAFIEGRQAISLFNKLKTCIEVS